MTHLDLPQKVPMVPLHDRTARRTPRGRGFTLIELMSVVVIIGILASFVAPRMNEVLERARVARAIGDLRSVSQELVVRDTLPGTLASIGRRALRDPWGRPYIYLVLPPRVGVDPPAGARLDRFGVALNSRFDLYSAGADGVFSLSLTAADSQDDIVVGGDGGYMTLASKY